MNDDDAPLIAIRETQKRLDRLENNLRAEIRGCSERVLKVIEDRKSQAAKIDRVQIITDWRLSQLEKRVSVIEPRPS